MLLEKEAAMTVSKELLDELLNGCECPEALLGDAGLIKELKINGGASNSMQWGDLRCSFEVVDEQPKSRVFFHRRSLPQDCSWMQTGESAAVILSLIHI